MADNVLEPQTFSFGDAKSASTGCSSRVWVSPTSILQRKRSRCIYVCIACGCYEISQRASQIWKSFCDQDRPFSSFTWCGRLFFAQEVFELAIAASRASWYQLTIFDMGYPAMTPQGRAGKRLWKGVGSPCRENGTQNLKSRWYEKPEPVVPILPWNSFHIP